MAHTNTPVIDTFTYANGRMGEGAPNNVDGGVWENKSAVNTYLKVISGSLGTAQFGYARAMLRRVGTFTPDQFSDIKVPTLASGSFVGVWVRTGTGNDGANSGYRLGITPEDGTHVLLSMFRLDSGDSTAYEMSGSPMTGVLFTPGTARLGCEVTGVGATVTLVATVDTGSGPGTVGTFTDTHANRKLSGNPAIYCNCSDSQAVYDDWVGGNLVAAPASGPIPAYYAQMLARNN